MREISYRKFSWDTHKKNWGLKRPNVCQFEFTFGCGLHCRHCYTDCYNEPSYIKRELNTQKVKLILDKIYRAGCLWLCFTGGDPLIREGFLDIYSYAKDKGFIITIFTNGYSMTKEIANYLKRRPPFAIELTLNAVGEDLYEKISQVKGSFKKAMKGIDLILKARLPLKIKTQITKDNLAEFVKLKKFIKGLGLKFRPSVDLHARLDGDLTPCNLRISPQEVLNLDGRVDSDCLNEPDKSDRSLKTHTSNSTSNTQLFQCAIAGGDGINLDPYGNTFLCNLIRKPKLNLLKVEVEYAQSKLLALVRDKSFTTDSKCKECKSREFCRWCPGKAYIETKDKESPISYYCKLTRTISKPLYA